MVVRDKKIMARASSGVCYILMVLIIPSSAQGPMPDYLELELRCWEGAKSDCGPDSIWFDSLGAPVTNITGLRYVYGNGTLTFSPFDWSDYRREIHSSTYHCAVATNMATGYQPVRYINVKAVGGERVSMEDRFSSQVLSPGARVSLSCSARGGARISWQRDGGPLSSPTPSTSLSSSGLIVSSLNFTRAMPDDGGLYSCIAYSPGNTSKVEHKARLDVYGPPYIRSLGPIKVLSGSTASIHCPFYGYPISKIQWDKAERQAAHYQRYKRKSLDEKELFKTNFKKRHRRAFSSDDGGLLTIENVDSEDDGASYSCTVTSPTGEMARRSFEIRVLVPPLLDELTFGSNIQEGQIAKVVCSVKSGDSPVFFSWLKDNQPISASLKIEERNLDLFSILIIRKVGLQHCGTYTCIASNHVARVNATTELFIKVSPKWLEEPQNSSVVVGRVGQIPCSANGYPQPQVHWMKKDDTQGSWRPVLEMRGGGLLSLPNGSLVIEVVSPEDEGFYSCRVENGVGQPLSKDIWIAIKRPVTFEVASTNITARVGHPVTITCEAYGDHPVRISWTHNGRALEFLSNRMKVSSHQTTRGATSDILMGSTDPDDAGHYQCRASNQHGFALHSAHLYVQEPPGPPMEVSVEGVRGRSALVGWRAPAGVPPPAYLLQYSPHHHLAQPQWDSAVTINITSLNGQIRQRAELTGLRPATPYAARLCSIGEVDTSPFTRPLLFTTLEEVPSAPPMGVFAEPGIQPGELQVSWLPPPQQTFNGLLLGYIIKVVPQINMHSEDNIRILKVSSHEVGNGIGGGGLLQAVVNGLLKSTRYQITVSCYNSVGAGPPSIPLYQDTAEGVPEVAPEGVSCSPVSPTSIRVSWSPLPQHLQGGAMLGYTVLYTTIEGIQRNITSAHSEVYLQGLNKFTNYSIEVGGHCGRGLGPLSALRLCGTLEDIPSSPADIKALVVTSTSILVSWQPPLHANGKLLHYTLYVKPVVGGGTTQSYRVAIQQQESFGTTWEWSISGGVSHAVRGLTQGRRYEAWVTANTKTGEGEPSRRVAAEPTDRVVAGVASLGGSIWALVGSSPLLACRALGSPQPRTVWYHHHKVITHHPRFSLNTDDSLLIHKIDASLEGNYTCLAKNLFGSDSVTYIVGVVSPPNSPALRALPARRGILLEWTKPSQPMQPNNRTSIILGYTVSWRSVDVGSRWESLEVSGGGAGSRLISGLTCGTQYEVRLVARASAGISNPAIAHTRTLGSVMTAPNGNEWIWSNSSHISLQVDTWEDGDCGNARFNLEYRFLATRQWLKADVHEEEGGRRLVIGGLYPARWYQLKVTAVNQAGPTTAIYSIATKTVGGEEIGPLTEPMDTSVLVMVCSCVLLILCMLICVFAAVQKHRHRAMMCGSSGGSIYKERGVGVGAVGGSGRMLPLPLPSGNNCPPPPARIYTSPLPNRKPSSANSEMFEISPYAQFSMGFQTFGHVDNQDRPAYVKAKQGVFSTETSFQMGSESEDSDSISKSTPITNAPNKMCRVQYHR